MPLLTKASEMIAVLPMSILRKDARLPNIEKSERKYIIPIIGKPLYKKLVEAYSTPAEEDVKEKLLIKQIQLPLAAFALHDDLPLLHAHITDMGVRRVSTGDLPAAFKWEFNNLREAILDTAHEGMEALYEFLFENRGDYELWTQDVSFRQYTKQLIRSGAEFSSYYRLFQPMRTFSALVPLLGFVKDLYLVPMIGEAVLNYFIEKQNPGAHEASVLLNIKKAAAHFTIKHACEQFPSRFSDQGFTVLSAGDPDKEEAGRTNGALSLLEKKQAAADRDGSAYLSSARKEIIAMIRNNQIMEDLGNDFQSAISDSPLSNEAKQAVIDRDLGNDRRKIFRLS